jgi:hypothetical protein
MSANNEKNEQTETNEKEVAKLELSYDDLYLLETEGQLKKFVGADEKLIKADGLGVTLAELVAGADGKLPDGTIVSAS